LLRRNAPRNDVWFLSSRAFEEGVAIYFLSKSTEIKPDKVKIVIMKQPCIYIMANKRYGTLYTGVSSNLLKRVYEHKNNIHKGFTSKYCCNFLVYYEFFEIMISAIQREKQIKSGSRNDKLKLIDSTNSEWIDLYSEIARF